jgi:tetratricopeptide (TPR) repeat protein
VSVVCGWTLWNADRVRAGEAHWRQAVAAERSLTERQWQGSDEEYQYLLGHCQKAAALQPGNVLYRHWLNVHRWHAITRTADPNTGEIVLSAEAMEFAGRIGEDLSCTRMLCPTFGATWCVLGQLERLVLDQAEQGARHIRRGVQLAPCDTTAQLVAGALEAEEGRTDAALGHLLRAVQLDDRFFREVALQLVGPFQRPDLALEAAGDDIGRLSVLADVLEEPGVRAGAMDQVRRQVTELLEQKCREPGAPAWALAWLAGMSRREGRTAEAIEYYREALAADYGKFNWHFELAGLLAEAGAAQEAVQEARVCLRLRPEHAGSRQLLDRLSAGLGSEGPGR